VRGLVLAGGVGTLVVRRVAARDAMGPEARMTDDPETSLRKAEEDKWQRRCVLRELAFVAGALLLVLGLICFLLVAVLV